MNALSSYDYAVQYLQTAKPLTQSVTLRCQDSSLLTPFGKANVLIQQAPNLSTQTTGAMIEALIIANITA